MGKVSGRPFVHAFVLLLAAEAPLARSAEGQGYQVAQGDVRVAVPLRPGGGFEARTTSLAGTLTLAGAKPVQLSGELQVDLATIDTGIDLRNRHLRENYLEIAKGPAYQKAVLTELRLGEADGEAFEGRSSFTGTLRLHNVTKPVAGNAEIRREGAGHRVVATFPLMLSDFGIEPPQYMGVGVGNKLAVKVSFLAARGGAR
jgi:polyisoprenoid-binding protein YceI